MAHKRKRAASNAGKIGQSTALCGFKKQKTNRPKTAGAQSAATGTAPRAPRTPGSSTKAENLLGPAGTCEPPAGLNAKQRKRWRRKQARQASNTATPNPEQLVKFREIRKNKRVKKRHSLAGQLATSEEQTSCKQEDVPRSPDQDSSKPTSMPKWRPVTMTSLVPRPVKRWHEPENRSRTSVVPSSSKKRDSSPQKLASSDVVEPRNRIQPGFRSASATTIPTAQRRTSKHFAAIQNDQVQSRSSSFSASHLSGFSRTPLRKLLYGLGSNSDGRRDIFKTPTAQKATSVPTHSKNSDAKYNFQRLTEFLGSESEDESEESEDSEASEESEGSDAGEESEKSDDCNDAVLPRSIAAETIRSLRNSFKTPLVQKASSVPAHSTKSDAKSSFQRLNEFLGIGSEEESDESEESDSDNDANSQQDLSDDRDEESALSSFTKVESQPDVLPSMPQSDAICSEQDTLASHDEAFQGRTLDAPQVLSDGSSRAIPDASTGHEASSSDTTGLQIEAGLAESHDNDEEAPQTPTDTEDPSDLGSTEGESALNYSNNQSAASTPETSAGRFGEDRLLDFKPLETTVVDGPQNIGGEKGINCYSLSPAPLNETEGPKFEDLTKTKDLNMMKYPEDCSSWPANIRTMSELAQSADVSNTTFTAENSFSVKPEVLGDEWDSQQILDSVTDVEKYVFDFTRPLPVDQTEQSPDRIPQHSMSQRSLRRSARIIRQSGSQQDFKNNLPLSSPKVEKKLQNASQPSNISPAEVLNAPSLKDIEKPTPKSPDECSKGRPSLVRRHTTEAQRKPSDFNTREAARTLQTMLNYASMKINNANSWGNKTLEDLDHAATLVSLYQSGAIYNPPLDNSISVNVLQLLDPKAESLTVDLPLHNRLDHDVPSQQKELDDKEPRNEVIHEGTEITRSNSLPPPDVPSLMEGVAVENPPDQAEVEPETNAEITPKKRKMTGLKSKHFSPGTRIQRTRSVVLQASAIEDSLISSSPPNLWDDETPLAELTKRKNGPKRTTGKKSEYFQQYHLIDPVDRPAHKRGKGRIPAGISVAPLPPTSTKSFGIIQEKLWDQPFWLLVAVTFLNKTTGRAAIPIFWEMKDLYPTPEFLARADLDELCDLIRPLGLQNNRSRRLIGMAQQWIKNPPEVGKKYRTLHYPAQGDGKEYKKAEIIEDDTDACVGCVEIACLSGTGPYAYDSWRMFCRDVFRGVAQDYCGKGASDPDFEPEWKRVLPQDKELRAALRWMWLKEGWIWDIYTGKRRLATEEENRKAALGELEFVDYGSDTEDVAQAASSQLADDLIATQCEVPDSQRSGLPNVVESSAIPGVEEQTTELRIQDSFVIPATGETAMDELNSPELVSAYESALSEPPPTPELENMEALLKPPVQAKPIHEELISVSSATPEYKSDDYVDEDEASPSPVSVIYGAPTAIMVPSSTNKTIESVESNERKNSEGSGVGKSQNVNYESDMSDNIVVAPRKKPGCWKTVI